MTDQQNFGNCPPLSDMHKNGKWHSVHRSKYGPDCHGSSRIGRGEKREEVEIFLRNEKMLLDLISWRHLLKMMSPHCCM